MTKITKKIHRLSERAAQIREALEAAPAKAAELRGAVTAAVGQVQQVRSELRTGVAGVASAVRSGTEASLPVAEGRTAKTLRAIEAAAEVLHEAGYALDGIDLEAPTGRVHARLWRIAEVSLADLRAVLELYAKTPVEKALVTGLVQAAELASGAALTELTLAEVLVEADSGKVVRIGWRAEEKSAEAGLVLPPPLPGAVTGEPRPPTFAQSNYFARPEGTAAGRTVPPASAVAPAVPAAIPPRVEPAPATVDKPAAPISGTAAHSRASALDRFKKMPDLTKK